MPRRDLDSILDECLSALAQGASIESCLARFPDQADRLRPLLTLAQSVRRIPPAKPSAAADATAWQRFYRRASDLRLARERPRFAWLKPVALIAAVVLAFVVAGGGTIYAASKSLPDSPLYRIKLASEDARLLLIFDDREKADTLLDQAETRADEIMALVQKGKPIPDNVLSALDSRTSDAIRILEDEPEATALMARAQELAERHEGLLLALWDNVEPEAHDQYAATLATVHNTRLRLRSGPEATLVSSDDLAAGILELAGIAEPTLPGVWRIGGVEVSISDQALGGTTITSGQTATVIAARGTDGSLRALIIRTVLPGQDEQNLLVAGIVETADKDHVQIAGQTFEITQETILALKLLSGKWAEVSVNAAGDRPFATEVVPLPEEPADLLALEGSIEGEAQVTGVVNNWLIGGQPFVVTPATQLDAQAGEIKKGARVWVEARWENGSIVAKRVVVLADEKPAKKIALEGVFESVLPDGRWRVSGIPVDAGENDQPPLGATIMVKGERKGIEITATDVFILQRPDSPDSQVKMSGIILRADKREWQVGFARVVVTDETSFSQKPVVGGRAIVWGRLNSAGTIEAVYIDVLDSRPLLAVPSFPESETP